MSEPTELVAGASFRFDDAVQDLVGVRSTVIEQAGKQRHVILPSLYDELEESRHDGAQPGAVTSRPVHESKPPMNLAPVSLLHEIDKRVREWWPHTPADDSGRAVTVRRLHALVDYRWAPEDVAALRSMTRQVEAWTQRVRDQLDRGHRWTLKAACPVCGEEWFVVDRGGEQVVKPALTVTIDGGLCGACGATWGKDELALLGQLVGGSGELAEEAA